MSIRFLFAYAFAVTLCAIAVTWPMAAHISTHALDRGDPLFTGWTLASVAHGLLHHPLHLFDAQIFHPHHGTLAYSDHTLGPGLLLAPVAWLGGGPVLLTNLATLLSFPIAATGMLLLVFELTKSRRAAVIAGLLFAFAHYRMGHLTHLQMLMNGFMPMALAGLHRAATDPSQLRSGLRLAAAGISLLALSSGYYLLIFFVALGLMLAWVFLSPEFHRPAAACRAVVWSGAIAGTVILLAMVPYAWVRRDIGSVRTREQIKEYQADWPAYRAAAPVNKWLGERTAHLRSKEDALFPGFITLALAAVALIPKRRERKRGALFARPDFASMALGLSLFMLLLFSRKPFPPAVWFVLLGVGLLAWFFRRSNDPLPLKRWLAPVTHPHAVPFYILLSVVGLMCSFGFTMEVGGLKFYTFYDALYSCVPGYDAMRVPSRFAVLASIGLAVLSGFGASRFVRSNMAALVVCALVIVEAWAAPLKLAQIPGPTAADHWLAENRTHGAIVHLPMYPTANGHKEAPRLVGATVHWRPTLNGYSSFQPAGYDDMVEIANQFPSTVARSLFLTNGVRFVVVHRREMDTAQWESLPVAADWPDELIIDLGGE